MPHGELEERRAGIDAQIASLEAQLRTLKLRRNSLSPTARLPPEILGAIFLWFKHGSPAIQNDNPPAWMNIVLVCQQWRRTALAMSSLWDELSMEWRADHFEIMVERSGFLPVSLSGAVDVDGTCFVRSYSQIKRLRKIHLNIPDTCIEEFIY